MKNENSHIYLYAKNHYQKGDVWEDMRKIVAYKFKLKEDLISNQDIILAVTTIIRKHKEFSQEQIFYEFLIDISPESCWKTGYYTVDKYPELFNKSRLPRNYEEQYDYWTAVLFKGLSIINMLRVFNGEKVLIEIDEPNAEILPLKKKVVAS
jgi:hypothetical protein